MKYIELFFFYIFRTLMELSFPEVGAESVEYSPTLAPF